MKLLITLIAVVAMQGCACNPEKNSTVFESKGLLITNVIKLENTHTVLFKSHNEPKVIRDSIKHHIHIEGIEDVSIVGYHTDQCTAEKMKNSINKSKPSLGYIVERKDGILTVETTGERRFIHHQTAFSSIKIRLPKYIKYQYIASKLNRG